MSERSCGQGPWLAALPMYDFAECRGETDALWADLRDRLRTAGVEAPWQLTRRNGDLPAVPGGIKNASGHLIAPDPATLPADELNLRALWCHPRLLLAQCCWGPLEAGLVDTVQVVGQPSYDGVEGGFGSLYRSLIVMRPQRRRRPIGSPTPHARIPVDRLAGCRLAINDPLSMSGVIALRQDLEAMGQGLDLFGCLIETGSHRASVIAVAEEQADVAAIDCRSWAMMRRFEPAAATLEVAGWTGLRKGLPYIASNSLPACLARLLSRIVEHDRA